MTRARLAEGLSRFRADDRWACLAAYGLLAVWCFPLYGSGEARGSAGLDWEWFLSYFEALRATLGDHGQFPGLNPWMYLGSPLWGNPQIGPLSHFTPLVLICGPILGMKLGIVGCYVLSFESARALGRRIFATPQAAVAAGLLYALNTPLAAQWVMGQACFAAYALAPLLVLCCLRLPSWRWAGAAAGAVAGLMVHYGVHYVMVYALLLCGLLALVLGLRARAWGALLRFGALFGLALLAVAAVRLLPLLLVLRDFPREVTPAFGLEPQTLWQMFFVPRVGPPALWLQIAQRPILYRVMATEFYAYPGLLCLGLALYSLRHGVRFYHVGALLSLLLMLGNYQPWHLSRWLGALPPFDAMWVVTRWRVVFVACLALAAAGALDRLLAARPAAAETGAPERPPGPAWRGRAARILAWAAPVELVVLLLPSWLAHVCPVEDRPLSRARLGLPQTPWMLAVRELRTAEGLRIYYRLFEANVGAAAGYDPLFGYLTPRSARVHYGHPAYRGEFTIAGGPAVQPVRWSPNRLRFEKLPPGRTLQVNLNPGRGWSLDGRPLFGDLRLFELQRPFAVTVPPSGTVDLRYTPPGLRAGAGLSLAALALLLGYWRVPPLLARRHERRAAGTEGAR